MLAIAEAGFSVRLRSGLLGLSVLSTVRVGVHSTAVRDNVLQGQRGSPRGKQRVLWRSRLGSWSLGSGFALHYRMPAFCQENSEKYYQKELYNPYRTDLLYTHISSLPHCLSFSQRAWRQIYFPPFQFSNHNKSEVY